MTTEKAGFLLLILYSLLSSSSCGRESISIEGNKEFPDNIGSWWKYKVSDTGDGHPDTVIITVIGKGKMDQGDKVTIWAVNSMLHGPDTSYVSTKSDGIRVYSNKLATAAVDQRYLFPLNTRWEIFGSQRMFRIHAGLRKKVLFVF